MKMLRQLPQGLGDPIETLTSYQLGDDIYTVQEVAGGRFIFLDEGGAETNGALAGRANVPFQEEVQDRREGQEAGTVHSQNTRLTDATSLFVSSLQTFPPYQRAVGGADCYLCSPDPCTGGDND